MNRELREVPSTIRFMDSPNTSATDTISSLSNRFSLSNLIVSHTITFDIGASCNLEIASPERTGCVAIAATDFAPSLTAVSAALQAFLRYQSYHQ